jgi:hypothetical protein
MIGRPFFGKKDTMGTLKLTPAAKRVLADIQRDGYSADLRVGPIKRLLALGLVEFVSGPDANGIEYYRAIQEG